MFYVRMHEICKMSGRTRGNINIERTKGNIPSEIRESDGMRLFDVDNADVLRFIRNPPKTATAARVDQARAYVREFEKRRQRGDIKCEMTGDADFMGVFESGGVSAMVKTASEDELDLMKKQKEVEKLDRTVSKMDLQTNLLKGDLIERQMAAAFVNRYVGMLHKNILDIAGNGLCNDLFNTAMKHKDLPREGVKAMEVDLAKALSDLIKDAISAMDKNPL